MTVVQKLLHPRSTSRIVNEGYAGVGGYVADARDVASLPAAELVAAYGWEEIVGASPDYVDVLRFETNPMMQLTKPDDTADAPWPTYPTGFLKGSSLAPVWHLAKTRVPVGAEFWRVRADGEQRMLSVYGGLDRGWANARGYTPPTELIGTRAEWRGLDLIAALVPKTDQISLLAIGDAPSIDGFTTVMPGIHGIQVPVAECDAVFEVILTARTMGSEVRFLERVGDDVRIQVLAPDQNSIERLGAQEVEPGIFEARVPVNQLTEVSGVRNELPAPASQ